VVQEGKTALMTAKERRKDGVVAILEAAAQVFL
jgi:hypothetical protein